MPERQVAPKRREVSLNGTWQIAFDPGNVGRDERWFDAFPTVVEEIRVPSVWNEMRPGYVGVAWYRTRFEADAAWRDRVVRIKFGAASYYAEVWLNGLPIGSHEGGYTPFALDADEALRPGAANTLVVRVLVPPLTAEADFIERWPPVADEGIDGFRLEEVANAKQFSYGNFGGLWQDVELVVTDRIWIADCLIKPNIREGSIEAEVTIRNDTAEPAASVLQLKVEEYVDEETSLEGEIAPEDFEPPDVLAEAEHALDLPPGMSCHTFTLALEDFLFWSPEAPFVYTLGVALGDASHRLDEASGFVGDSITETFGLREFTVEGDRFHLNGEPIVLKAALFQPSYPVTLAYPFDREFAEREIRMAKEAGFNCLRMHIKPPPPVTLEFCDKLGMLVQEEPPIGWIKPSDHMKERCLREVREMVLRDRNHPSVVMWSMLNETGNWFGSWSDPEGGAQTIKAELCLEARRHDPTRLIVDDSGGVEWTKQPARYMYPGSSDLVEYYDHHPYKPGPVDDTVFEYFRTAGVEGQLSYISEFGFGGLGDLSTVLEGRARRARQGARRGAREARPLRHLPELHGVRRGGAVGSGICRAAPDRGDAHQPEARRLLLHAVPGRVLRVRRGHGGRVPPAEARRGPARCGQRPDPARDVVPEAQRARRRDGHGRPVDRQRGRLRGRGDDRVGHRRRGRRRFASVGRRLRLRRGKRQRRRRRAHGAVRRAARRRHQHARCRVGQAQRQARPLSLRGTPGLHGQPSTRLARGPERFWAGLVRRMSPGARGQSK